MFFDFTFKKSDALCSVEMFFSTLSTVLQNLFSIQKRSADFSLICMQYLLVF